MLIFGEGRNCYFLSSLSPEMKKKKKNESESMIPVRKNHENFNLIIFVNKSIRLSMILTSGPRVLIRLSLGELYKWNAIIIEIIFCI